MIDILLSGPDEAAAAAGPFASPAAARAAGGRITRALGPGATTTLDVRELAPLTPFVEGLALGAHRLRASDAPARVHLVGADADTIDRARLSAAATLWARELTNTPASVKTPTWLARQAERALVPHGVDVRVHDARWLAEHGFGGVLAVGGGSAAPPAFVHASWRPRGARAGTHVVLVGKGITFDTGGLNLKRGDGMRTMYTDMAGGAAVVAALRLVAQRRLPLRVTALVPAAENSVSGSAYRPGDVVRHYGGRTSEITNTDAEGRLVLADAMAYAVRRLRPTHLVDIATLTGAIGMALGSGYAGLFATTEPLAAELAAAGEATGEQLWRMPFVADYQPMLDSSVADGINAPPGVKALVAALFLREFAGDVPWAHLDIAGTGRAAKDHGVLTRGATGFGARLLARWLEQRA